MQLRYRGISYTYNLPQFFPLEVEADCEPDCPSETTLQLRVLRYRGIFYGYEVMRSPKFPTEIAPIKQGSVGYLTYRLYRLGWQSCLHQSIPQFQRWLLNIFLHYRRGFIDAAQWAEACRFEHEQSHQN